MSSEPFKIVAFGDSLTAGYGVAIEDSYPSILQNRLREKNPLIEVVNMGISGETTTQGLERVQSVIDAKPNLVLVELGANDMPRSVPTETIRSNLDSILQKFKEADINVVLLGMRSFPHNNATYRNEFADIYTDLAKKHNTPLVPFFLDGVALNASLNIPDRLHPNAEGYIKIVDENILPVLQF